MARALQKIGGFEVGGREGRGSRQLDDLTLQLAKELAHGIDLDEGLHAPDPEHIEKVEEAEANTVSCHPRLWQQLKAIFQGLKSCLTTESNELASGNRQARPLEVKFCLVVSREISKHFVSFSTEAAGHVCVSFECALTRQMPLSEETIMAETLFWG